LLRQFCFASFASPVLLREMRGATLSTSPAWVRER
jgi:hypothetical protein